MGAAPCEDSLAYAPVLGSWSVRRCRAKRSTSSGSAPSGGADQLIIGLVNGGGDLFAGYAWVELGAEPFGDLG
jgi:hypothetical protein